MRPANRRFSPLRASAAVALTVLLVLPEGPAYAQRRGGGGGRSRGSVNSVNRSAPGTGGSWSGPRTSGSTSRTATGSGSGRTTTATTRSGQSATGTRNVTKSGRKVLGAAALGAGIGGMIDGGEGAAWGAGAGAVVGVAAAKSSPGNQVTVAPGTALEFRLARPLSVDIVV